MENISLFGKTMCEKSQDKDLFSGGPLDVVRMEFVEAETLRWEDLFSGFDSLRAITYSSAIGFVYQLVDMFEDVEVIFGSEEVLSYSLQEIMAYQCKMVDRMRDTASKMKIDLEDAKRVTEEIQTDDSTNNTEESYGISGLFSKVTEGISKATMKTVDKFKRVLNNMIEALAVMLVTSCLIPILVIVFFSWLVKLIFGINIPLPSHDSITKAKPMAHQKQDN